MFLALSTTRGLQCVRAAYVLLGAGACSRVSVDMGRMAWGVCMNSSIRRSAHLGPLLVHTCVTYVEVRLQRLGRTCLVSGLPNARGQNVTKMLAGQLSHRHQETSSGHEAIEALAVAIRTAMRPCQAQHAISPVAGTDSES